MWAESRALQVAAAGLVGLGLLTGCGSSSVAVTGTPSLSAYRSCLQDHGEAVSTKSPEPVDGADAAVSAGSVKQARKECAPLRPPGTSLRASGFRPTSRRLFENCMAAHGVHVPTPTAAPSDESYAPRGGMLSGLDRKDPKVAKALDACAGLLLSPTATATP